MDFSDPKWTPKQRKAFRSQYKKAVLNNKDSFVMDGQEYLVVFAKYVIEFWCGHFHDPVVKGVQK